MAVFKCKMCGGALDIQDGSSVAVCSFCGTKQTIPKLDNETRVNLYDRANHFRRNNDYDKAMSIYEQLLAADKTDAEAYWSIVLCKYGIEYVEDPKTRKMVPTINRAQYTSIFADEDYKSALRYADGYQRTIYETEAKELDKIQKGILAISQKEEPFDVFICYKETDSYGRRTHDSVLAQDLYFQLKQEGFKVFFSRITLEDKLGVAYEPYIFAALNTAKVMVVVGTSKENLNAVWVKNEWSRFLALIKKDSSKVLIPAYRDMDPYDLPEEFSHLQAQDMSKLGFMQDLIRGIKKIARTTKPQQTVVVEKVGSAPANTDALIKRAFLFLEDGDWTTANKYAERVLDNNPECSKAYLVKLLAELNIRKPELLSKFNKNLLDYSNFKKAVRFADSSEREVLANYNKDVANNIKQAANERVYSVALKRVAVPSNEKDLKQSIADLRSISGYKDADTKAVELEKRLENFLKKKREAEEKARIKAEEEKIRKERLAEEKRERARKHKKIGFIVIGVSVFLAVLSILTVVVFVPMGQMDKADKLFSEGRLEDAMTIYKEQYDTEEGEAKYKTAKAVQALSSSYATTSTHYSNIQYILSYGMDVKINYSHDLFEEDITGQKEDKWIVYQSKGSWEVDGMPTPIKPGYYFVSWKFVGYGMDYKDRIELTFEPTWTPANYHITYNLMGGTNASKNPTKYTIETESFMISNPTREGYIFEGWTSSTIDAPTKGVIIKQGTIGNITLTAHWSAADYVIYLDARGGSGVSSSVNVKYGRSYTLPTPTKLGYTFIGWCQRDNDQFMTQAGTWQRTSNLHLYAVWEEITYNITYDLDGGFLWLPNPSTYTISTSTSITREPTKTGYTFLGWTHANLQTPTKNLIIEAGNTGNITLTANWQVNTYTITYDANGGEVSPATQNVVYGTEYTLARPTREGYDFGGWLYNDAIQADGVWSLTTSPTFVAQWTAISYSISYELNGGSVVLWVNPTSYTIESSKTIHNPTKTGYTFLGWTYEGQTEPVLSVTIPVGSTGDKHYVANWQVNTYTITYDANGGEVSPATQDVVYGTEYTLAKPTRVGYDFGGWLYNDNLQVDGIWSLIANPTFVAQWTATPYNITYELNGGSVVIFVNPTAYTIESSRVIYPPTKTGYTFLGWTWEGQTEPVLSVTIPAGSTGDKHYVANWQANTYTITYDANGGEVSPATQDIVYGTEYTLATPTRVGYDFGGWLYNDTIQTDGVWSLTTSPTFVAQWTAISYSISYELNGGSVELWVNPTSYTIESSKTIHNPTKTGYTFLGWTYEGQTTPVTSATIPVGSTGDKYYIANWQANTYTIAYDANGGEISLATQDVVYGTEYTLATPTREGYDFGGWLYNDTIQTDGMWSLTTSPTFVAQWTARTDVAYVVNHYQENANNSSYTLLESQNLEGTADAEIVPARRSYAGFTSPAAKTVKVKPNGTLVVDYYYTRNLYTINFVTNGGETISSIIQKYESAISLPNACREGVTLGGWFDDINLSNQKELTTMPIDGIILYAYWTEENKPSDFTYSGTSAIIINSYVGTSTTMRVPEHIGGLPVTTIASSAFANKTTMVEAVVPNTVTSMGSAAFKGCSALESITIPFVGLSEDSSARYGLFGIMFNDPSTSSPGSNIKQSYSEYDSYYFNVPESIRKVVVTKQDFVSSGAFNNWNFIEEIWYHQIIDTIGYSAFSGCSALKKISCGANGETSMILNAVKIRGKAFAECASLEDICQQEKTTIAFSDAINEIEYEAFRNAKFIVDAKKIVVPNSATIIGNGAFEGAASLEEIVIPFIGTADDAYQEDAVFGAIFGYSERYEEGTVCQNYMGFSNYCNYYYIPQTIKRVTLTNESGISNGAFNNCSSLTSITILSSVTRIGDMSFSGCSSLTSIVIPDSVTTIGDEAFKNCSDLTSIAIPDKVTSIGRRAFENCSSLTSVAFEDPNGWYVSTSSGATSGTDLTLADAETNATHLKSTYYDYYWYKL